MYSANHLLFELCFSFSFQTMDTKTILIYGFAAVFALIEIALTEENKVGKWNLIFAYLYQPKMGSISTV